MLPQRIDSAVPTEALVLAYRRLLDCRIGEQPSSLEAIPVRSFRRQLELIRLHAGGATSLRDWLTGRRRNTVVLTFDGGSASDRRVAMPLLLDRGMRADFFVCPSDIGGPGASTWAELRQMAAAGMSIQSRGYDATPLTRLGPAHLRESIRAARLEIEVRIGSPVTLLAPPAGLMPQRMLTIAQECGYGHVVGTRPGWLRRPAKQVASGATAIPRVAVRWATDDQQFCRWIDGERGSLLRQQVRHGAASLAESLLGTRTSTDPSNFRGLP